MAKLTKRVVDTAVAGRAALIWDDKVKGFGLGGAPRAALRFACCPTARDAAATRPPQRRLAIRKEGSPWTSELARREAPRLLGAIAARDDPVEDRKAEARTRTLAALLRTLFGRGRRP